MKSFKLRACLLFAIVFCASALAHKPLLSVDDNEDGTIYIEVGFSDGSSGAGHELIFKDTDGKVLSEIKVPEESSIDVDMPAVPYTVTFYAGEGHAVTVDGPFSEQEAAEAEEEAPAPEVTESAPAVVTPAAPAVQPAVAPPVQQIQPVVVAAAGNNGRGFDMALKMMVTTNIIVAVMAAFILALCAFAIGYSVGKAKK